MNDKDRLKYLYTCFPPAAVMFLILAVLLVVIEWDVVSRQLLISWLALLSVVLLARTLDYWSFNRQLQKPRFSHASLLRRYHIGIVATGIVWGLVPVFLFPNESFPHQLFLAFVMAGITAAATVILIADKISPKLFIIPVLAPLIVRLALVEHSISWVMGLMVFLYLCFLLLMIGRSRNHFYRTISITNDAHKMSQKISASIVRIMTILNREAFPANLYEEIIKEVVNFTGSEYGFIGDVLYDSEGVPYLKTHVFHNITWNNENTEFYNNYVPPNLEFRNLNTLFGAVITSQNSLIANDPASHPKSGGLPKGHPPLRSFLGLPVLFRNDLIAMMGIANAHDGYNVEHIKHLTPILTTIAFLIKSASLEHGANA